MFHDRKFRMPRIWSNSELKKYAQIFSGSVVNVSGWKDIDKQGKKYQEYFINAQNYEISNYKSEKKGLQGLKNEFYLDLTDDLNNSLIGKYDVVFNHTTLEHIYNVKKAFKNLCLLSKDMVIIVVPFLQQMHGNYGDFWRFTPLTVKKLFEENGLKLLYLSFNNHKKTSIYIFAIGSKFPEKWNNKISYKFDYKCKKKYFDEFPNYIGCNAIPNPLIYIIKERIRKILRKILRRKKKKNNKYAFVARKLLKRAKL